MSFREPRDMIRQLNSKRRKATNKKDAHRQMWLNRYELLF